MRFHVLGLAHTVSTPEYTDCAFTQKIVRLCKMLKLGGHTVFHYGHADSTVECDENVRITKRYDLDKSYPGHDWRTKGWPVYNCNTDWAYKVFDTKAPIEVRKRFQKGDFLLVSFAHRKVVDALKDTGILAVEAGIGYPSGTYTDYRVYESYAVMHAYMSASSIQASRNNFWYDAVIPNYYDLSDFEYSAQKDDYFLFLGRVDSGKGIHIVEQLADACEKKLIVAGGHSTFEFKSSRVERVGVVRGKEKAHLLAKASATICPSNYLEPFCGVHVESMISGTPVITSDWGAFAEYNRHGVTGYRCKTFEQFEWAAKNIHNISPAECRKWGERFSLKNVLPMYEEYFQSVWNVGMANGWYTKNPERKHLAYTSF